MVGVFCDNSTAVAYLRNQGGTLSESLNGEAQAILRWAEERGVSLIPQFILGSQNTVADSLSRQNQVLFSEWTLSVLAWRLSAGLPGMKASLGKLLGN